MFSKKWQIGKVSKLFVRSLAHLSWLFTFIRIWYCQFTYHPSTVPVKSLGTQSQNLPCFPEIWKLPKFLGGVYIRGFFRGVKCTTPMSSCKDTPPPPPPGCTTLTLCLSCSISVCNGTHTTQVFPPGGRVALSGGPSRVWNAPHQYQPVKEIKRWLVWISELALKPDFVGPCRIFCKRYHG